MQVGDLVSIKVRTISRFSSFLEMVLEREVRVFVILTIMNQEIKRMLLVDSLNKRFFLILLLLVPTVLLGLYIFTAPHNSEPPYVIIFDGSEFSPSIVEILVDTQVVFKNESENDFWPASDLHPSHTVLSEFDPREPVLPGENWSFIFSKAGTWHFHDHLFTTATGTIRVFGSMSEAVPEECIDIRCWKEEILAALTAGGVEAAFERFSYMYENVPGFSNACHAIVHVIGENAYYTFNKQENFSLTNVTSYCGYGFYHGFMETLLVTTGDMDEAREFCRFVDEQLFEFGAAAGQACYHGVGHGFTDGSDPRTWGNADAVIEKALQMCIQIAETDRQKYLCGTGVFNGLAVARHYGLYGLVVDPSSVFEPCEGQNDEEFKLACYEQMNTLIDGLANNEVGNLLKIIKSISEPEYTGLTLQSAVSVLTKGGVDMDTIAAVSTECITEFPEYTNMCIGGIVSGIVEFGTPTKQHFEAIKYCTHDVLTSVQQVTCFKKVVGFAYSGFGLSAVNETCAIFKTHHENEYLYGCLNK
ncbi:hypothetical protein COB52_02665 [Candidatus Kaiserbacteria bacterium]|nr:MAG: hypothetical protein COB52_02665 [Candidatus Kaiserbacteria bacterium]